VFHSPLLSHCPFQLRATRRPAFSVSSESMRDLLPSQSGVSNASLPEARNLSSVKSPAFQFRTRGRLLTTYQSLSCQFRATRRPTFPASSESTRDLLPSQSDVSNASLSEARNLSPVNSSAFQSQARGLLLTIYHSLSLSVLSHQEARDFCLLSIHA
jgi:hypothetical protein